jgi:hypothetical protein
VDGGMLSSKEPWKGKFYLSINPGLDFARAARMGDFFDESFKTDPGYRLGALMEFGLAFDKNKWSLLVEPTFQASLTSSEESFHQSLEIPIGMRHYFFLAEKTAVFIDAFLVADFFMTYRVEGDPPPVQVTLTQEKVSACAAAGVGLRRGKLSLEARYYFKRTIVSEGLDYNIDYVKTSVILGYRIKG